MSVTATISHISRCSVHDGPGIRTVVYLKGCGLRCRWCHNPETFSMNSIVMYNPIKCIHCSRCVNICPDCHKITGNDLVLEREKCTLCGRCVECCPSTALSFCGETKTVEEVLTTVRKDKPFYDESGGGITLSGGECLLQPVFAAALLKACKEEGIHTAIETALFVDWAAIEQVLPYTDLFFADVKCADSATHREYTGHGNERILDNLYRLSHLSDAITVRIPLIPGVSGTSENMRATGALLQKCGPGVKNAELLRYNPLGSSKYDFVGLPFEGFGEPQSPEEMEQLRVALESHWDGRKVFFRI